MTSVPDRLSAALAGSPLCVGIDPHAGELAAWGLEDTAAGARAFADRVLTAVAASPARIVKPQVALFERFGSAGFAVLEEVLADARGAGLFTIADAKRGDIGSTMSGYASAWVRRGSPLRADAVTVSPYLGFGSLAPVLDLLDDEDAMAFVLALTSNPSGPDVQHARGADGESVGGAILRDAAEASATRPGRIGAVVGATIGSAADDLGIDLGSFPGPILTPGYGAQGAGAADLLALFGPIARDRRLLVNASRGVSSAGPSTEALTGRIAELTGELLGGLGVD
ncbi:orotidine-5'-phosphate decarboxylase [Brevibacterium jeotgali]|uniref:Orotidine-5'-phosphate decarboxylase n=1 Tax=Brevibacterium jeotgali TaxID=1262550 RepID=A0A2H1L268_9MICO|nr:orotidine-5'-phosphate decarboxylase [Brevibacterium jeotgali]TWC02950.1 orotidine-5'-phosphate decarboxylase [Brevibacterium jeotgali]SMY10972.1 orotidine-5'-phosphate decarboxylase [Brevibacterium jeotgali]